MLPGVSVYTASCKGEFYHARSRSYLGKTRSRLTFVVGEGRVKLGADFRRGSNGFIRRLFLG